MGGSSGENLGVVAVSAEMLAALTSAGVKCELRASPSDDGVAPTTEVVYARVDGLLFRAMLEKRLAELSDPEDKPWPFVRFPSVPSGKAGMTVPVFGLLSVLAPRVK